jgi:hypothetical protein
MAMTAVLGVQRKKAITRRRGVRLETVITVCMGAGVPLLSLSLSNLGGRLLASGPAVLGVMALELCVSVLAVSWPTSPLPFGQLRNQAIMPAGRWQLRSI